VKTPLIPLIALGLVSCGAPKSIIVAEAPIENSAVEVEGTAPAKPQERVAVQPADGLRIGEDMLALPSDEELRTSVKPAGDGDTTVITRPPAE